MNEKDTKRLGEIAEELEQLNEDSKDILGEAKITIGPDGQKTVMMPLNKSEEYENNRKRCQRLINELRRMK